MTDRLHLSPKHRAVIEALLQEHLPGVEVWAYGSRVDGRSHDGSDLDLVLRGPGLKEIPIGQVGDFEEAVRDSTIPFPVEARDWARLPERFHREIEREHVVLVERQEQDVVDGWRTKTFADAPVEIIDGDRGKNYPRQDEFFKHEHCMFLNAGNVTSNGFDFSSSVFITSEKDLSLRKGKLSRGDVVLTTRGTVGKSAYFNQAVPYDHIRINSGMVILRAEEHALNPLYLYLFIRSKQFLSQIAALRTGSAQPQLPIRDINRIKIPLPPLPEQRAIAHVLGTLDDKIELNRRTNETLEAMARALFKSWFVDFDPVRAKACLTSRQAALKRRAGGGNDWTLERARAYLDNMDEEVAALFPDSFVDSELGEIPEGWGVVPLLKIIEVNPTRSLKKGEIAPYLDMANMPTKGHEPDTVIDRPFGSGMRFANGDTLVARITPCLENGKTAYVDFLPDGQIGWGSTEYIVLRPKPPLPDEFAYCLARSAGFRKFAIQNMTGTSGRQRVPAIALSQFLLPSPPKQITAIFGRVAKPLFARSSEAIRESHTRAVLRDTLLTKLISGEIRVPSTENAVEATT